MKKFCLRLLAALLLVCAAAAGANALTIGTFNIEFFHIAGTRGNWSSSPAYTREDVRAVADSIRRSGADVLALQEIQGETTMRFLTLTAMQGWKYYGLDMDASQRGKKSSFNNQNVYFLWNPAKVTLLDKPKLHHLRDQFTLGGRKNRVFDRPPLEARFRDNETGREFTLVGVHLKSLRSGSEDEKQQFTLVKRAEQVKLLNALAKKISRPAFILGDYNSPDAAGEMSYPLLTLERGSTYDSWGSCIDFIGYVGVPRSWLGAVRETETRIPRRSTKRKEHPDHDILTLHVTMGK